MVQTNQEVKTTEITPIEKQPIVTLLKDYPPPILGAVLNLVQFHSHLLEDTKAELEEERANFQDAEECQQASIEVGIPSLTTRYKRMKNKIEKNIDQLERKVKALEAGFLQIPRFDWATLEWSSERLNYSTLKRLKEAKEAGIFDDFGVVQDKYTRPHRKRDPILIGIIRGARYNHEEHFFIGTWK